MYGLRHRGAESDSMVDSESEFHDALAALLVEADRNGIDVEGGWNVRNPDETRPDWTVEITRIAKALSSDSA